jgi:hypothetical protein
MPAVPERHTLPRERRATPGSTFVTRRSMAYNGLDDDVIAIGPGAGALLVAAT